MRQYLLMGFMILVGAIVLNQTQIANHFPIRAVKVYGAKHADQHRIEEAFTPFLRGNFFNVHIEEIRDRLLQQPWVADVVVRRIWPDRVEAVIIEKTPVARWWKSALLSETGVLFIPDSLSHLETSSLPIFEGPVGEQIVMLKYFNEMNRLLAPLHVKITHLVLSPYQNWQLQLSDGVILQMGHKDVLTRLDHFVKVYPKIVGDREALLDSVDLRYPNGVAVRWKKNYGKEANQ